MRPGKVVALTMALVMILQVAGAQELPPEVTRPQRAPVYAAEFGAGLAGFALVAALGFGVLYGGAWITGLGLSIVFDEGSLLGMLLLPPGLAAMTAGLWTGVGSPLGGAIGVRAAGNAWREGGTLGGATIGAYLGLVPSAGIGYVCYRLTGEWNTISDVPIYALGTACAVCVAAGATVGYNLSIPESSAVGSLGERLESPGVTFTSTELPDHSVEYGVRVQLAGLRF
jgi:hypothetical protein